MKEAEKENKKSVNKKLILAFFLVLLTIILIGITSFLLYENDKISFLNKTSDVEVEADEIIIRVGKLIKLPNETPEIATVTDVEKLQDQTIFKNAQNGDRVLIFAQSKKAIVYRPSENILIEVGNIVLSNQGTASANLDSEVEERVIRVAVFNATTTPGYAGRIGDELKSKFPNLQIVDTSNAAGDYEKTKVIDLSGENPSIVDTLVQELGGEVDELPKDEEKPDSDILIILGE